MTVAPSVGRCRHHGQAYSPDHGQAPAHHRRGSHQGHGAGRHPPGQEARSVRAGGGEEGPGAACVQTQVRGPVPVRRARQGLAGGTQHRHLQEDEPQERGEAGTGHPAHRWVAVLQGRLEEGRHDRGGQGRAGRRGRVELRGSGR